MLDRRSFIRLLSSAGLGTLLAPFLPQASSIIDQSNPLAMRGWSEVMTRVDLEELVRRYTILDPVTETMIHPDRLRGRCPFCQTAWDSLLVYCDENLYHMEHRSNCRSAKHPRVRQHLIMNMFTIEIFFERA
jgi:hypothetical protein